MNGPSSRFCTRCGAEIGPAARFCSQCGAARDASPATQSARPAATSIAGAVRVGQTAASVAGSVAALPWKTVVRGETPDLSEWLRGGAPIAQQVIRRSVRKPAVVLGFTTTIDALVAVISGQPAALTGIGLRLVSGLGTSLLGLIVGKRGGFGRVLVGVGSLVTSAVQLWSVGGMLVAAIGRDASLLSLVPSLVSAGSVLLVTVKTAFMTFRNVRAASAQPRTTALGQGATP